MYQNLEVVVCSVKGSGLIEMQGIFSMGIPPSCEWFVRLSIGIKEKGEID